MRLPIGFWLVKGGERFAFSNDDCRIGQISCDKATDFRYQNRWRFTEGSSEPNLNRSIRGIYTQQKNEGNHRTLTGKLSLSAEFSGFRMEKQ